MGDYYMLRTMQIVPGCTDFLLNNSLLVGLLIGMKGLEGYTFTECLNMASIAEIEGFKVSFLHINHLKPTRKLSTDPKASLMLSNLEKIKKLQEDELRKKTD